MFCCFSSSQDKEAQTEIETLLTKYKQWSILSFTPDEQNTPWYQKDILQLMFMASKYVGWFFFFDSYTDGCHHGGEGPRYGY